MDRLKTLSTFDLVFNLAMNKYNESEKFAVLDIIKERDRKDQPQSTVSNGTPATDKKHKPPLKGSKAEKIKKLIDKGKTAREIFDSLNAEGTTVYYPEIYRLMRHNQS